MTTSSITIPFIPRPYQEEVLRARAAGYKRGILIAHRRAGKDLTMLNMLWVEAVKRVGLYNYYFPTYALGKKIIWKGMDREGRPFLSYIPAELIRDKNETDLRLELINGSVIQLVGTENINQALIGINPVGCVFSEYSVMDPLAWELTRPILAENGGWAWFVYTPRGRNHAFRLYEMAREHPEEWFVRVLSIRDTTLADGSPVVTEETVQREIAQGMDPDLAAQEFYCSWDAPMQGSYYGRALAELYRAGHVGTYPYDPSELVSCAWDLGVGDQTAIWFAQVIRGEVRLIDYYEHTGEGFDHYFKVVMEKPYVYETMFFPHDIARSEWGTGKSVEEMVRKAFRLKNISVVVVPRLSVEEGIQAVRRLFPRLRINAERCEKIKYRGHSAIDCLASYHKRWNEQRGEYEDKPFHDWSSHCADALRYLALGLRDHKTEARQVRYATSWNPMVDTVEDEYEHHFNPMIDEGEVYAYR